MFILGGGNFVYFWTQGGLAVVDDNNDGMGIALPDCPAISLGTPGIYRFENQWDWPNSRVHVNLFNNQWNTNFRSFWQGNLTVRARLWAIDRYAAEKDLTTPLTETLAPLLAGMCNYGTGNLPQTAQGLSVLRKGVLLTALGPNPDGQGTLLRVWEDAGQSGPLTITLPRQTRVSDIQPIDFRGRPVGPPIQTMDDGFTFELGAFRPASFLVQVRP